MLPLTNKCCCKQLIAIGLCLIFFSSYAWSDSRIQVMETMVARCMNDPASTFAGKHIKDIRPLASSLNTKAATERVNASDESNDLLVISFSWLPKGGKTIIWQQDSASFYLAKKGGIYMFSKGFHSKECQYTADAAEHKLVSGR